MLDQPLRSALSPGLTAAARGLVALGISANQLTGAGLAVGTGACVAVADGRWWLGLGLWLLNRVIDGFDGAVARLLGPTELGGFFDIMSDFAIYGGMLLAIGIAEPDARVPALVTLLAYYLSGSSFLAWSSLAERLRLGGNDGRSLNFPVALAEGAETIAATGLVLALPRFAAEILWIWAAVVFVSVGQRLAFISRRLRDGRNRRGEAANPVDPGRYGR